jgi:hypothetical protein
MVFTVIGSCVYFNLVLGFAELASVHNIFFFGFYLQVRSGISNAQQNVTFGLKFSTHPHTTALVNLAFNNFSSTGSTNPCIARIRQINAGGVGCAQKLLIFGHFYGVGTALVEKLNGVSLGHIFMIGFKGDRNLRYICKQSNRYLTAIGDFVQIYKIYSPGRMGSETGLMDENI